MRKIYTLALVIAAVLASMPLYGQSKGKHPKWVDYTGTHEVDVSVGFPTAYALAYMADMNRGALWLNNWAGDIIDRIDGNEPVDRVNANAAGGDRFIPNLRAEYGYNVLSWLNVGVAVNYSGCSRPMEDMDSGQYLWAENTHFTQGQVLLAEPQVGADVLQCGCRSGCMQDESSVAGRGGFTDLCDNYPFYAGLLSGRTYSGPESLRPYRVGNPLRGTHSGHRLSLLTLEAGIRKSYYAPVVKFTAECCFATAEQGVQQGVEGRSVVRVTEVAELVQYDVVLQMLREENQAHIEVDIALRGAGPPVGHVVLYGDPALEGKSVPCCGRQQFGNECRAGRFTHSFQFCRIVRYGGCPSALSGSVHLSCLPLQSSRDPLPLGQKELLCDSVRQHPRYRDHDSPAWRHAYAQPRCARPLDQQHFPYSGNLNYLLPGHIRHHRKILK